MADAILIKFLIIISVLFIIPRILLHWKRIQYAITETLLGLGLGLALPAYFFLEDWISILAALGIITLFVTAGMEVDIDFVWCKKRVLIHHLFFQMVLLLAVIILISYAFGFGFQLGALIGLALLTPSAGFILSIVKKMGLGSQERKLAESIVMTVEITGLLLLLLVLNINNPLLAFFSFVAISLLIMLLPRILTIIYMKMRRIIGMEFAFIFVVALLSAYITEMIGVHFLIGAFVAGIVAKKFLLSIQKGKDLVQLRHKNVQEGFLFFSQVFAPFYFFSIGLRMNKEVLSLEALSLAILLFIFVTLLRIGLLQTYLTKTLKQRIFSSINISIISSPTLIFTFVIADIIWTRFHVGEALYGALLIYGIFTAIVPLIFGKAIRPGKYVKK